MYCARCGAPVGAHEATCQQCGTSLYASGAVRLTDPKLDPAFVPRRPDAPSQQVAPQPARPAVVAGGATAASRPPATGAAQRLHSAWLGGPAAETSSDAPGPSNVGVGDEDAASEPDTQLRPSPAPSHAGQALPKMARVLGIDMMAPTAKVTAALLVLLATLVIVVFLMAKFMNLDRVILAQQPISSSTPTPSATPTPTPTPTPQASKPTTPSVKPPQTPSMDPAAKECDPGVWAGPRTSCGLANAVGKKVDRKMTGVTQVTAFSTSTQRDYTLECTAGKGISCVGLNGVQGVLVWLVV